MKWQMRCLALVRQEHRAYSAKGLLFQRVSEDVRSRSGPDPLQTVMTSAPNLRRWATNGGSHRWTAPQPSDGQLATAAECGRHAPDHLPWAGRQPGTIREIRPLHLSVVEVRAFDVAAGSAKTFLLSKIALPGPDVSLIAYAASTSRRRTRGAQPRGEDGGVRPRSAGAGVGGTMLERDEVSLSYIYAYFKNGKPRRRTPIRLMFNERPKSLRRTRARLHCPDSRGGRIER